MDIGNWGLKIAKMPNRLPDDGYSSDRKSNMQIGPLLAPGEVFRRKWNWYDIHMPECLETKTTDNSAGVLISNK